MIESTEKNPTGIIEKSIHLLAHHSQLQLEHFFFPNLGWFHFFSFNLPFSHRYQICRNIWKKDKYNIHIKSAKKQNMHMATTTCNDLIIKIIFEIQNMQLEYTFNTFESKLLGGLQSFVATQQVDPMITINIQNGQLI